MSYQEPEDDDEPKVKAKAEDSDDEDEFADKPWQTPFAWLIITGEVDVPNSVHAAAVNWFVGAFSILE